MGHRAEPERGHRGHRGKAVRIPWVLIDSMHSVSELCVLCDENSAERAHKLVSPIGREVGSAGIVGFPSAAVIRKNRITDPASGISYRPQITDLQVKRERVYAVEPPEFR